MDLNKYQNMFFQKIKQQISDWFESREDLFITNKEVYRFLHSIKGSSGTLQLGGLYQISADLMGKVEENDNKMWKKDELRIFLDNLINLTYNYEHFSEEMNYTEQSKGENVPLIQIIDDDISMLTLLKDTLEERGWMVVANTSPGKAITQFYDLRPDCVIIDVNLKNRTGFQVLKDLQQDESLIFIPKIMISILNDRETRIKAYRTGADDFIPKPIDLEELTVRIDRHLQRKNLYDQAVHHAHRSKAEMPAQGNIPPVKKTLFVSIIDDDVIIRTMLTKILKTTILDHYELDIESFENGLKFFDSSRLENPGKHFLILDGVMPIIDGIEILQKVKHDKNKADIHVLMLTGRKREADIERALKLGADDYVTKPFSIKELQARIQRLIQRMR